MQRSEPHLVSADIVDLGATDAPTAGIGARQAALVLAPGAFESGNGKTAHGLVRGSDRFDIVAVLDASLAGRDAGESLDGRRRDIPIVASLADALAVAARPPQVCVVGLATHGGRLTAELRDLLLQAIEAGLSVVNGLHEPAGADSRLAAAARARGVRIHDIRQPSSERRFWTGAILAVRAPRLAVLGTDCAVGKRTTARLLMQACRAEGMRAEMIYTGQTGWMQGGRHGFILDATPNDFVGGELEHAVVTCDREEAPDLIVIEGQGALRSPSGPCGAELLVSARARGVILQHAPGRRFFGGHEALCWEIPPIEEELALIELYGARTLAVTLNGEGLSPDELCRAQDDLAARLGVPVLRPLEQGAAALVPIVRRFIEEERS